MTVQLISMETMVVSALGVPLQLIGCRFSDQMLTTGGMHVPAFQVAVSARDIVMACIACARLSPLHSPHRHRVG